MMPVSLLLAIISFIIMLAAFFLARFRYLHIPMMLCVLILDIIMPFYLYQVGDWERRLIDQEEIFSFLIWMHFGLIISLYVLFVAQIYTAWKLVKPDAEARQQHRFQGRAALFVKGLVVLTGAILVE